MYPISNAVKALFESEQKQILRITGGEKSPISKSVGPSAMASFSDAIAAGALNLSVDITPVQSGSGDPSPTNVRPISGWTGANVTRTGFNVWDEEWEVGGYSTSTGEKGVDPNRIRCKNQIPCKPNTLYYNCSPETVIFLFYDCNSNYINYLGVVSNHDFTTPHNACYIAFYVASAYGTTYNHDISINYPSTDTAYHPYQGTTYDITFPASTGTVYGGMLDVTTGLLTVDRAMVDMTSITNWVIDRDAKRIYKVLSYIKPNTSGATIPNMLCNRFETITPFSIYVNKQGVTVSSGSALQFHIDGLTDKADVTSAEVNQYFVDNPTQVVYELAEPQTYQLTPTQIALLEGANNVWADCGDVTVEYATGYEYEINITDADVVIGSFNIDRFSCIGNKLEVGTATSAQMTVKLDNYDGRFNGIVFEGTELFVEIGIADWTQSNPTVNWIPCGYFTPDEQPRSLNIITIHALDRMMQFDATMPTLTPWVTQSGDVMTDSQGNIIYFVSNVQFPVTVQNLVKRVALLCGVPFTQSLSNLPNYNYTLSALPTLQQEITFRNIIQWCAGIMGANAWIDWTGSLRFSWYGATTGYTSTTANRFSSDLHEDDITITGVQYTNTQNVTIVSGSDDYALDMTGNYLAATGIAEILPNVKNVINGFSYRPFTASVINAPYLWPMDMITFVKDGVNHTCAVTNVNFGINGATALEGKGETAQTNSGTAPSGVTKEQGFLIEQAAEATRELDGSLNQEGIFNRLTNNGEVQGLILYNGKVYLNASYIQTGTLVADFIKGGTLKLGGLNNANGVLQILNSNGDVIGTWNNTGININGGWIKIPLDSNSGDNVGINYGTYAFRVVKTRNGTTYETIISEAVSIHNDDEVGILNSGRISVTAKGDNILAGIESYSKNGGYFRIRINEGPRLYMGTDLSVVPEIDFNLDTNLIQFRTNFTVTGTKSRSVTTDQYSDRLLYCYETPSPMFGDVGEGTIGEDGKCYIWIDPVFAQTITTTQYQVFLQRYGSGECWVSERKGSYFVVEGTPGMAFGWELKAKQRDFDQRRLERNDEPFTVPTQTYGEDAAKHIDELRKERISA